MTIAGQTFTILQDAGLADCMYFVFSAELSILNERRDRNIQRVFRRALRMDGDKQRQLDNHHIIQHGHWDGAVNYSVAGNTTGLSRKGRITIGGQRLHCEAEVNVRIDEDE